MNTSTLYSTEDYYSPFVLSSSFLLLAMVISFSTISLIWRNKPRLHTVNHLLICNTSIATVLYSMATITNYFLLVFIRWETNDMTCRWRAYFEFIGIAGIFYSYLIQAISRFFFSVVSRKYRFLTTFQTHYNLIIIGWFIVLIVALPTLITDDIHSRPGSLCWISSEYTLHIFYAFTVYYVLPVVIITIIYIWIYYRVRRKKRHLTITVHSHNNQKRDLQVLRNIIILISVLLIGGLPAVVSNVFPGKFIYLLSLTAPSFTAVLAEFCLVLLDRELRQVIKNNLCRASIVTPVVNAVVPVV